MNVDDLVKKAKEKVYSKKIEEWTEELERLIEKEQRARLVLENIQRELEDKKLALNDKIDSLMSCKLSGFSGKSTPASE